MVGIVLQNTGKVRLGGLCLILRKLLKVWLTVVLTVAKNTLARIAVVNPCCLRNNKGKNKQNFLEGKFKKISKGNENKELLGRSFIKNINVLQNREILFMLTGNFHEDACARYFLCHCNT